MQKFLIEVKAPTEIRLTDNDHFEEYIILEVKPHGDFHQRGFDVIVKEMTNRVSIRNDPDEFANEFTFDKKEFEERMEKLRSK
jgi:hypothetical protein